MHLSSQVDMLGPEARQDVLDKLEALGRRSVLDNDLRGRSFGAMHHNSFHSIPMVDL